MRILIVNALFKPFVGGSAIFCENLVEELERSGHHVAVCTTSLSNAESRVFSLKSFNVNLGTISLGYRIPIVSRPGISSQIRRILHEVKPEVVSIHGQQFDLSYWMLKLCDELRIPTTLTIHSPIRHTNKFIDMLLALGEKFTFAHKLSLAKKIITVDKQTRDYFEKRYPNLKRLEIKVSLSRKQRVSVKKEFTKFGLKPTDFPIISSIGHVIPLRNRKNLILALPNLMRDFPNLKLVVAGSIKDSTMENTISDLQLESIVNVIGEIAPNEVTELLSLSDIECHAIQGMGIGLASLHAMNTGVPSIFFAPRSNWEDLNLDDYEMASLPNGAVSEIELMIRKLATDDAFRQSVVNEQNRFLEDHFSLEKIARKYIQVFKDLLNYS